MKDLDIALVLEDIYAVVKKRVWVWLSQRKLSNLFCLELAMLVYWLLSARYFELADIFGTSRRELDASAEVKELADFCAQTIRDIASINYPFVVNRFGRDVPQYPAQVFCSNLSTSSAQPKDKVQALRNHCLIKTLEYRALSMDEMKAKTWQHCTQLVYGKCAATQAFTDNFGIPCTPTDLLDFTKDKCRTLMQAFNVPGYNPDLHHNPEYIAHQFGIDYKMPNNIPALRKAIISGGNWDPKFRTFRADSVSKYNDSFYVFKISSATTGQDFFGPNTCDPDSVAEARTQIVDILECWVNEADPPERCTKKEDAVELTQSGKVTRQDCTRRELTAVQLVCRRFHKVVQASVSVIHVINYLSYYDTDNVPKFDPGSLCCGPIEVDTSIYFNHKKREHGLVVGQHKMTCEETAEHLVDGIPQFVRFAFIYIPCKFQPEAFLYFNKMKSSFKGARLQIGNFKDTGSERLFHEFIKAIYPLFCQGLSNNPPEQTSLLSLPLLKECTELQLLIFKSDCRDEGLLLLPKLSIGFTNTASRQSTDVVEELKMIFESTTQRCHFRISFEIELERLGKKIHEFTLSNAIIQEQLALTKDYEKSEIVLTRQIVVI
uniref:Uncharacterized protein n=1 Tax=Ditylenchus dipsaci TaxID=166011 RepID=A0A915E970_9BILA